ncbi:peroxisomal targeting signal 2 receptor [Globomyces sp. JEL0801]|nr:peroxisomal targeting signal 2 receptor [Globomyces sp. JEL0801]
MPKSLQTWQEHTACIYQTTWCPHNPDTFASASGDQTVKLWDVRQPRSVNTIHAHTNEILALDWNKYKRDTIVTGSVDTTIKEWDLKMPNRPLNEIKAHDYAVRRLKCSPHDASIVASVSYDMTMRLWNLTNMQQIYVHDDHTEFVLGVDFNLFQPGLLATCAWDGFVDIFHP